MKGMNNLKNGKENSVSHICVSTPNGDISPNHGNQENYVSTLDNITKRHTIKWQEIFMDLV